LPRVRWVSMQQKHNGEVLPLSLRLWTKSRHCHCWICWQSASDFFVCVFFIFRMVSKFSLFFSILNSFPLFCIGWSWSEFLRNKFDVVFIHAVVSLLSTVMSLRLLTLSTSLQHVFQITQLLLQTTAPTFTVNISVHAYEISGMLCWWFS
jgi:hypothetical protein